MSYRYCRPVSELQSQIDSREFAELWAEERLEPRGIARQELQFARLMCLLANINRDSKKPPFKWQDFVAEFTPREVEINEDAWFKMFAAFAEVHNANYGNHRKT